MLRKLMFVLLVAAAGCHAGARLGPVHGGGGVTSVKG